MSDDPFRDQLHPADAPNPIVWCERCRRFHPYHTFTQADYDKVIRDGAEQIRKVVDTAAIEHALKILDK